MVAQAANPVIGPTGLRRLTGGFLFPVTVFFVAVLLVASISIIQMSKTELDQLFRVPASWRNGKWFSSFSNRLDFSRYVVDAQKISSPISYRHFIYSLSNF